MRVLTVQLLIAVACALFAQGRAWAQEPNPYLAQARRQLANLDEEACLETLEKAKKWHGNTPHDLALVHLYEGLAHAQLAHEQKAIENFKTALLLDPTIQLPGQVAPRILAWWRRAAGDGSTDRAGGSSAGPDRPPGPSSSSATAEKEAANATPEHGPARASDEGRASADGGATSSGSVSRTPELAPSVSTGPSPMLSREPEPSTRSSGPRVRRVLGGAAWILAAGCAVAGGLLGAQANVDAVAARGEPWADASNLRYQHAQGEAREATALGISSGALLVVGSALWWWPTADRP